MVMTAGNGERSGSRMCAYVPAAAVSFPGYRENASCRDTVIIACSLKG